ncbi:MAG TPA: hypothetical protein VMU57_14520 [Edaphobacter sp.]|uniref:hypothetical protein n=1 Tax=Edaphobacter sp. TaxID=1934404 RepID=UPI002BFB0F77|nr:hypothetical protein [Edaphobacter sp.]HUZ96118.1 hypothetical protein [Edaphobacter sp.]
MLLFRCATATVLCSVVSLTPTLAHGQEQNARDLVQSIVDNELKADTNGHSRWIYRDAHTVNGKSTVKLVVQIPEGDVSKTIEMNGHPLTAQQQQTDKQKMHRFVTDPAVRQKQKRNRQQNGKKVASMMKMLPGAFLWTGSGEQWNSEPT